MSKCLTKWLVTVVGALVSASVLAAGTDTVASSVAGVSTLGVVDTSQSGDGLITVVFSDVTLELNYAPPSYNGVTFQVDAASGSGFVGNYVGAGIDGMRVVISCVGAASPVRVWLRTADGRTWVNHNVEVKAGGVVTNMIPFTRGAGWTRNEKPGVSVDALWSQGLERVAALGFGVSQDGYSAQNLQIRDLRLYGSSFMTDAAILSRVAQHFGVGPLSSMDDLSADLRAKDSDKDGVADVDDVVAGRVVRFLAEVRRSKATATGRGVLLRWPCVNGARYTVCRSLDLNGEFDSIAEIVAENNEHIEYEDTDASGLGPYYYRVVRE